VGRLFNRFVPLEAWIRKANRDLVIRAQEFGPEYLLTFGQYSILAGALAQIRASVKARLIHIWPDTLLHLRNDLIACLPLLDLFATYSQASVEQLQKLGARDVAWIPLAGDPAMHAEVECSEAERAVYGADVTFIGGWRPEREAVLSKLESFELKIWGPGWGRRCRGNKSLLKAWQGRSLYEAEFGKAVSSSKINLNIIDPLNYPAANMRFFEVPVAGGLQISSPCPEMENEFLDGEHLYYYKDTRQLKSLVEMLIKDTPLRSKVAKAAQGRVLAGHTYQERANKIMQHCEKLP
jgi:spore maturation protein CgeB